MSIPAVKGYMPLCVTPRSQVCDEQGVGQWPMWKRFDSVKAIINQYVDEPYREFLAMPYHEVDKMKAEELFYWYTPRREGKYVRLSQAGDDKAHYKQLLDETLAHYGSVVDRLKKEGIVDEASFLELSLKYAGDSEDSVYCGNNRVVATVWGMRPRQGFDMGASKLEADLFPPTELHTVRFELGNIGDTDNPTVLKKSHGTKIFPHQIPQVRANKGHEFIGWDKEPLDAEVIDDMSFVALYKQVPVKVTPLKPEEPPRMHQVRFLKPDGELIKQIEVEHGTKILPGLVPQLPVVGDAICSAWDGDPLNDTINDNRDYTAIGPTTEEKPLHNVRFLTPDGMVISQFQVEHNTQLVHDQIPPLPDVDGVKCSSWDRDPLKEIISDDVDFTAIFPKKKRKGLLDALLRWLLLLLGLLLLFLFLWCFLFGKCHYNLCGCDCDCDRHNIVRPEPMPEPPIPPQPDPVIINDPDSLPKPTSNCGVHFSGWFLSDKDAYPWNDCSRIFENDEYGEYVGQGLYPDNTKILPRSMQHTFDAVAVGKGTHLTIYSQKNFEGRIVLDVDGPMLIENIMAKPEYSLLMTYKFDNDLQSLFPSSRREWSSENMHNWANGSCKIICQQCDD